jgi:FAD/FMN-containing dehydrogenase/Fe-S oxidoreductase
MSALLDHTPLTRALYSSDASLYRVTPAAVAQPRTVQELAEVLDLARASRTPVTMRGAGTSCAGNAIGSGIVVDTSRHLTRILDIDPGGRTATVEPGVIRQHLQDRAAIHRLRFGPDPSTSTRCTIGGMIGNNACGPRAMGYGRTADNLLALDVITGTGERLTLDSRADLSRHGSPTLARLLTLVEQHLGLIRTEFGTFGRQVSGYSLEHLLPENGFNVTRFLAGSEGTLATVTKAVLSLAPDPTCTVAVALGYPSMPDAADAVVGMLPFHPTACEGFDRRIADVVARKKGSSAVPELPRGDGWIFLELAGEDPAEVADRARALLQAANAFDGWLVADAAVAATLWRIRADGAGLAGVGLDKPAFPGWEDAAVPPQHLGAYLREFDDLLTEHGLHALPYGHFGDGCVHARIDLPLDQPDGKHRLRAFMVAAAELVGRHRGSMSGEHGDGRARSELLGYMYSPEALRLFAAVKHVFDPDNLLNPGVLVDPAPLDEHVRLIEVQNSALHHQHPRFSADAHRCTGVGRCVSPSAGPRDVMCPSFRATRQEKDSTRGRAHVLQEMLNGATITSGFGSPEVLDALDLCLACKGCARDCPAGVDMAELKSRTLDHAYRRRLRPRSHYSLGWLPRWGEFVTSVPLLGSLSKLALRTPGIVHLTRSIAGVDQRRPMPMFRTRSARRSLRISPAPGRPVALWIDSFSNSFSGTHLPALVAVLIEAGYAPQVIEDDACCGLTWITTGQRDKAAARLRAAVEVLHPYAAQGIPILGVEPSCLAVWRSDAPELVDDPRVRLIAGQTRTLAELLTATPGYRPPNLAGHQVIAQPHCHHASVLGWAADAALLAQTGAEVVTLGGCCGLAGNFGVEQGHYDVSVQIAGEQLLPALRANPHAIVLADGFSCRKQVNDLSDRHALTLAELLYLHRPGRAPA